MNDNTKQELAELVTAQKYDEADNVLARIEKQAWDDLATLNTELERRKEYIRTIERTREQIRSVKSLSDTLSPKVTE